MNKDNINSTLLNEFEIQKIFQNNLNLKVKADRFYLQIRKVNAKKIPLENKIHLNQPIKIKNYEDEVIFESKYKDLFDISTIFHTLIKKSTLNTEKYLKEVIEPFIKIIEPEISKLGRKVSFFDNKILMLFTLSVEYLGSVEYVYIIQIKTTYFNNKEEKLLIIKESSLKGSYNINYSLSGRKISEIGKEDLHHDFLESYKKYMNKKGWIHK